MSMIDMDRMRNDPRRGFRIRYETQTSCDMMMPEDMSESGQGTTASTTATTASTARAPNSIQIQTRPSNDNIVFPDYTDTDAFTRSPDAVKFPYPGAQFIKSSGKNNSKKPKKY